MRMYTHVCRVSQKNTPVRITATIFDPQPRFSLKKVTWKYSSCRMVYTVVKGLEPLWWVITPYNPFGAQVQLASKTKIATVRCVRMYVGRVSLKKNSCSH